MLCISPVEIYKAPEIPKHKKPKAELPLIIVAFRAKVEYNVREIGVRYGQKRKKELLEYQIRYVLDVLEREGLI